MAEEDDADYWRRVREVLIEHDFAWVVAQAEAQIAEGKPNAKQVSEREHIPPSADPMFTVRRPRSRRASLITSEPYNESERLEILLDAIEAAIVQRSMVEQAVFDQLTDITSIRFEPDSPVEPGGETYLGARHVLDSSRKDMATELESRARAALSDLRGRDHAGT
jgi:hypothetical protein